MGHKDGAKGGYRYHDDGGAGFDFMPEDLPDDVCLCGADSDFGHAYDGYDDHGDGEAEGCA